MLMAPNLRVVEPNNIFRKVPSRRPNAEMRTREYLTPHEVEKLIVAAKLGATATGTLRWSSWPFATVCGPSRSPTWSGRKSNGVAIRRYTSVGQRTASPQFTLIRGDELRMLRELQRNTTGAFVFETERGGPFTVNRLLTSLFNRPPLTLGTAVVP
jgi:hypothetical protein